MKIQLIKNYKITLFIFTLLTFTQVTQAQLCGNKLKLSGKYEQKDLEPLLKETSNFLKAYETGNFSFLTDNSNQIELKAQYEEELSFKERKGLLANIESICLISIKIYDGSVYAGAEGKIKYKDKKENQGIFFYVNREENKFSFTKLMFSNFDIYELIIPELIEDNLFPKLPEN